MEKVSQFGIVAIGRNEGDRLVACLKAAIAQSPFAVYVDSGSTDGSVENARSLHVEVVELDLSAPFTAARARNVGCDRLLERYPHLEYVQFVDGDCTLIEGWCDRALAILQADPTLAVVCGRRRERFPQASIFNALCDFEWNTPVGEALACGGDALMRVAAFQKVGGYAPSLIAGEEPELCFRLRQQGGRILRIDWDMTWHDAQMLAFSQWWRRAIRGGHAFAEVSWLHRRDPEGFWQRESRRIWLWGAIVPLLSFILLPVTNGWSGLLWLLYLLLGFKTYRHARCQGSVSLAFYYGVFCTLAKFPELQGQLRFHLNRFKGDRSALIEYK
ncbi:glycosyltransferase family 2 protein [Altericista sp. CCNU0014]|uniref:glycosyltransferase family 2 protein n=1 Tax=Altericista sp. CCNU0014 TaxID=3082949 RepID=UPI00384EC4CB